MSDNWDSLLFAGSILLGAAVIAGLIFYTWADGNRRYYEAEANCVAHSGTWIGPEGHCIGPRP
jgi:hypothetical protein